MNRNKLVILLTTIMMLCLAMTITGCTSADEPQTDAGEATVADNTEPAAAPDTTAAPGIPQMSGDTVTTASGLKYVEVTVGDGAAPEAGNLISAHYTGWLTDGTKFDSSRDRGAPLKFPVGQGRVIKGWDEGLMSMKVGGRRMLIIPPELGYGERGTPGGPIPPNAQLVFDVELVDIETAPATP